MQFREEKVDSMQFWMTGLCDSVVEEAISARLAIPNARNMTGNLLGSIACGLYRDKELVYVVYSSDKVRGPIRMKMTARRWSFAPAWDGGEVVRFNAEVETNRGFGFNDATRFISNFQPRGKALLQMVLAYTTEYAAFVEAKRKTTGYFQTVEFICKEVPKIKNAKL